MTNEEYELDPALSWAVDKYLNQSFLPAEQLKKELRKSLLSIVGNLLEDTTQVIPIVPELLAPKRKIQKIIEADLMQVDGLLIPRIGGFLMKIKSNLHPFKKRFAIAHEIGHTFFFNIDADPPRREFQYQKSSYWVEEDFSCAIAREILIPKHSLFETIERNQISPSIDAIRYLSSLYQVSFDVIRMKAINDNPLWDCLYFRSSLSEGKAFTITRDISKGISFRNIRIPRIMEKDSKYSPLLEVLYRALEKKYVKKSIKLCDSEYSVETLMLNQENPIVMTVITES